MCEELDIRDNYRLLLEHIQYWLVSFDVNNLHHFSENFHDDKFFGEAYTI